jgi:hypothetical protein
MGTLTKVQSSSLQSTIPSQSSSMILKPPHISVCGGAPQSFGQLQDVSGGKVQTLSPQTVGWPTHVGSAQSVRPLQSLSSKSLQAVSDPAGRPQSLGQLHGFSHGLHVPFPQQMGSEKHSESTQSTVPSQSLSTPSVQLVSVAVRHSGSHQSVSPSQSLSRPSMQLISVPGGDPQSAGQLQWFSAALQTPLGQQKERHCGSAQSAFPLQSLSAPSAQFVSVAGGVPQSGGQLAQPPHRSQPAQDPFTQIPHGTDPIMGTLTERQSSSLQSIIPSQSSSMGLKPPPHASVAGGVPQSNGQLQVVSGGVVHVPSPQALCARAALSLPRTINASATPPTRMRTRDSPAGIRRGRWARHANKHRRILDRLIMGRPSLSGQNIAKLPASRPPTCYGPLEVRTW